MEKEKYLLKKQKKEQERLQKLRKKKIKKIIMISIPLALFIGGAILIMINIISAEKPEIHRSVAGIEIEPIEYDAGTVSMADGAVEKTYEIKNTGEGDLEINGIKTSCMCTIASLRVGDKKSPKFGMHDNPLFWSQIIAPGEIGYLDVSFDTTFHGPEGTGSIVRVISISTNDPDNKDAEVRLLANVIN